MKPEERKAAYKGSAIEALMQASGHTICERCWCCDVVSETETCWQCGGFDEEMDDWEGWPPTPCSVCGGEGKIFYRECIGRCDETGNHKPGSAVGDR